MPGPLVAAIPWVLSALGGGALSLWATSSDDEWRDVNVFNSRMRQIQLGILQLNTVIAQCPAEKLDANGRKVWKDFVLVWSGFYRDVGRKVFSADKDEVSEAKRFAAQLNQWIGLVAQKCGPLPTGLMPALDKPPESPLNPWGKIILYGLGITTGGVVLAVIFRSLIAKLPTLAKE